MHHKRATATWLGLLSLIPRTETNRCSGTAQALRDIKGPNQAPGKVRVARNVEPHPRSYRAHDWITANRNSRGDNIQFLVGGFVARKCNIAGSNHIDST